ncbi:hypothetical protein GCM10028818_02950 [Spirosoma horti]
MPGSYSQTATIPANLPTGTYTVGITRTPVSGPNYESPRSSGFTINAVPSAPGVSNLAYCVGATGVPPLTAIGQNLKWYTVSTGGTGSTTAPTPPTSTTGTTNYYVSQTSAAGCEGPRATLAVTINPKPAQPTVVSSVSYCQNSTAPSLASSVTSGSNLKWYATATGGTGSTVATTPSTGSIGSTTYYVSQTNGSGCESDRSAITVTIKPSPAAPTVTSPAIYCQGQPAAPLSATPVSGGSLNWFGPANNSLGSTAPTPPTSAPGTTFYSVSQTVSGCTGPVATISVMINPKPVVPITTPVGVCQGTTPVSLATGVTSGTNLRWYTAANGGTGSTVAPTPSTGSTGSTTYYVSQTDANGCESDRAVITYTVNAYPAAPSVSPGLLTYCQNSTAVPLTATGVASATLTYYTVASGGTPFSTLTPATDQSNNYYVSQTLNGCEGPRATIPVVINALPARPAVTTPLTYCQFTVAAPLSATASTANNTLSWYGTNDQGGTASSIAPTPSTTTDGAFTYYVSQKDPIGCESPRAQINVTINPKPAAPTVVAASACLNSVPAPLTQSVTATGTLKWYTASTGGTGSTVAPTLSTTATGSSTYYVSQTNGSGCESDRSAISFTVNPLPVAPVPTPATLTYCQNAPAQPLTANGQNLKWYLAAMGGSPLSNPVTPSTALAGPITYYVSQTDGNGCESPRASVTVTTVSRPAVPTVSGAPITYCQFATAAPLSATPITGNTLSWYGNSATGGTATSVATVPGTATPGNTQYYVSQTDGNGCESSSRASIAVTVNPAPTAPTVVSSVSYCQNSTPVSLASAVTSGTNLTWYTAPTGGIGSSTPPTPPTSTVGTTTYYVSQTNAEGCESVRSTIAIIVRALPVAPTVTTNPQNLCQSSVPTPLTAVATGTLTWYSPNGQVSSSITPSTNVIGPTSYSVSQTVDGCEGPKATLTVVVIPKPVAPTVTTPVVYEQFAAAVPLSATASANYSLSWYGANATGGTASTIAPTPPTTVVGSFTYYVSQIDPNGCESDRASINVTITPRPVVLATVTTDAPTSLSATTAILGGNVTSDGGATVSERGIVYLTGNGTPTTANTKLSIGSNTGSFSATVTNLTPGNTYSVRAYAINSVGTSYGTVQTFTTLSITATPVLLTPPNGTTINSAQPTYTGTAPAGSTVTLYVDNTPIGTTIANGGSFSLTQPIALTQGLHSLYATAQLSGQVISANSTMNTFIFQPVIAGGADLTPTLSLPQSNFAASGPESVHNLTMTIAEQVGKPTAGTIVLTLTPPLGYTFGFDPTLTSINVTGGTTNPVAVNNATWEVRGGNSRQLTLVSKAGQGIAARGVSVIGLILTRTSVASAGTANLTVNVNDDVTNSYDSNPANNIYIRILNSL